MCERVSSEGESEGDGRTALTPQRILNLFRTHHLCFPPSCISTVFIL
jgi:hypothetical protein